MLRRPDLTLDRSNIVIRMLPDGMINKQVAWHFQACEYTISSFQNSTSDRQTT